MITYQCDHHVLMFNDASIFKQHVGYTTLTNDDKDDSYLHCFIIIIIRIIVFC